MLFDNINITDSKIEKYIKQNNTILKPLNARKNINLMTVTELKNRLASNQKFIKKYYDLKIDPKTKIKTYILNNNKVDTKNSNKRLILMFLEMEQTDICTILGSNKDLPKDERNFHSLTQDELKQKTKEHYDKELKRLFKST